MSFFGVAEHMAALRIGMAHIRGGTDVASAPVADVDYQGTLESHARPAALVERVADVA
jgi:hypothetical protein